LKFLFPQSTSHHTHVSVSKATSTLTRTNPTSPRATTSPAATQHTQKPRIPTSNFTLNNIELHAKPPSNSPKNTIQNQQQRSEHKLKSRTFTLKKISALNVLALHPAHPETNNLTLNNPTIKPHIRQNMPNPLETEIAGLQLRNPTILAAGILGLTTTTLQEAINHGAGAVVTKSISQKPRTGYNNPTIAQIDNYSLLNAMGLPNPGANYFAQEIRELKKQHLHAPVIASVIGFTPHEYTQTAQILAKAGADAIELNISCPHVKKTGSEIGQNPNLVSKVVKQVKNTIKKPVIVKLTPNVTDIVEIAKAAVQAGADAVTAINTLRAMTIDTETHKPILANKIGGLSGQAIKPIAIRCVYEIHEAVNVPIIGCGGITTHQDAVEFMLAGATAIQIGTAIATQGLNIFKTINKGINTYLHKKNLGSVKQIIGLSHHN